MNKRLFIGVAALCFMMVMIGGGVYMERHRAAQRVLRYGLDGGGWGPLYPAQQSSLDAAIIISHVFDSLVGVDNTGGFIPNLAKSWDIDGDSTVYTFAIDTDRKFSDGTRLTAQIYKASLLHALSLEAAAANRSALDVLYALKGYDAFASTGDIEGLEVEGDAVLRLRFARPFRRAIDQLSGTRYGAAIMRNGAYLGTGPYVYDTIGDSLVRLSVNPYYPTKPAIDAVEISEKGEQALFDGTADVVLGSSFLKPQVSGDIAVATEELSSLLQLHRVIVVNGMRGRIFADAHLRRAAQYILHRYYRRQYESNKANVVPYYAADIQFYPSLYAGHLDDGEAEAIVEKGRASIDDLRAAAEARPIQCVSRGAFAFNYCDAFAEYGIKVVDRPADFAEIKSLLYKTHDADLVGYSVSYASADPDGIYHFLGKHGAIWSPLASRKRVEELVEDGRRMTSPAAIDEHYKKVGRAILEEVPVVHLGQQRLYLLYNADRLKAADKLSAKRKALNVTLLEWR